MKLLLLLATLFLAAYADNYAVLVAGSNGFYNYRHQSDVCHAYHVLIDKGGVKPENIILFSYGDVAPDAENPFPNTLYNKPTTGAGIDVNKGCVIDYSGEDVTPENYLKVLRGQSMKGVGSGRTLQSTSSDNVFLAFFDHGASGLIAFPSSYLYASDLLSAINDMHTSKMYNKLVYYLEACESGSMFVNLPKNINAYALSASSPDESSWGTYCPPDDSVNGTEIGSCLGDLFSVNWMEDSDVADLTSETLQAQFTNVKTKTSQSQVMQWGDISWTTEPIGNYLGKGKKEGFLQVIMDKWSNTEAKTYSSIDSRDIKLQYLVNKFKKNPSQDNYEALNREINQIKYFTDKFTTLKNQFNLSGNSNGNTKFDCYKKTVSTFESQCGKVNEYSLKYFKYFTELCQNHGGLGYEHILGAIQTICSNAY